MATHSSILVWETPWTEEPGRLQSMGYKRVRHDLVTKPLVPPSQVKCLTDQGGRMVFGNEHGHGICQKLRVGTWLAPYGCGSSKVSMCQSFFFLIVYLYGTGTSLLHMGFL